MSAVVVDLPLVPVMATNGASGASFARSRQNSSMSPMISTPAAFASLADQCGSGWVSGTPGREDERGEARPVGGAKIGGLDPLPLRLRHRFGAVVAGNDARPAALQRQRRREPRAAESEERDGAAGEGGGGGHAVNAGEPPLSSS